MKKNYSLAKKLLIIGAGTFQVPLIAEAKKSGYFVTVVSPAGNYPGIKLADEWCNLNVLDEKSIIEFAKNKNFLGVCSDQTDIAIRTVAKVATALKLRTLPLDIALNFTDKARMRELCAKHNINTIPFARTKTFEDALQFANHHSYPLIIKPVNNQGSRGISKINSLPELKTAYKYAQLYSNEVIIEKFITGDEYVVEGVSYNNNYRTLCIGKSTLFKDAAKAFSAASRVFTAKIDTPLYLKLDKENEKITQALGLKNSLCHSEFIISASTGEIYLIESGARGGGAFISSHIIPLTSGFSTEKFILKNCTGQDVSTEFQTNKTDAIIGYMAFYIKQGNVKSCDIFHAINELPFVEISTLDSIECQHYSGEHVDKTSRQIIVISANSMSDFNKKRQHIINKLSTANNIPPLILN